MNGNLRRRDRTIAGRPHEIRLGVGACGGYVHPIEGIDASRADQHFHRKAAALRTDKVKAAHAPLNGATHQRHGAAAGAFPRQGHDRPVGDPLHQPIQVGEFSRHADFSGMGTSSRGPSGGLYSTSAFNAVFPLV